MAETPKKKVSLPVARDAVKVETPQAETESNQSTTEAARAERAKSMSVAKDKTPKTTAEPFKADSDLLNRLLGMTEEELVKEAMSHDPPLLRPVDAQDRRVFRWTGSTVDVISKQEVSRSKLRSMIVEFLKSREGDLIGHVGKSPRKHAAEGRAIHAFMVLGGPAIHAGKYDAGYLGARRGENKTRGMVARGLLEMIGDNSNVGQSSDPADSNQPEVADNADSQVANEATTAALADE